MLSCHREHHTTKTGDGNTFPLRFFLCVLVAILLLGAQHIHAHHGADDGGVMLFIEARRDAQAVRVFAHEEIAHASPFIRDVSKQPIF